MLDEFITLHRDEIIRRCRAKVARRSHPPPTDAEIDHGVPLFLNQLVDALRAGNPASGEISASAVLRGHDMLREGFTVSQVVHDYGDVCQSITELAVEIDAPISVDEFRLLNGCLDNAIAGAVTQYGRERNDVTDGDALARDNQRLGFFAHELRNLLHTALIAFDVVKSGDVGLGGSTGTVLHRSLLGARDLIARSLTEVRLTQGIQRPERFLVSELIDEVVASARLASDARGITLTVPPFDRGLAIDADRAVLGAALSNVIQNAVKFTRARSTVTLRVEARDGRVTLDVEDACGGLSAGNPEDLFRPFEQRSIDKTGLGLGLAFSRWAVEANHGRLSARDRPGVGCVFTIDLPVHSTPPIAVA